MLLDQTLGKALFSEVKAAVFDVYGALCHIADAGPAYRKLLSTSVERGRSPRADGCARAMTSDVGLAAAAELLGMALPIQILRRPKDDLAVELASVRLFKDASPAIVAFKRRGLRIGL